MEKNKLPLMFSRIALVITIFIWFIFLTVGLIFLYYLIILFIFFLIPTILNFKISYEKHYEDNNPLWLMLLTLFSYIGFGTILITLLPYYIYMRYVFFIPQTIFLILACLTFKKQDKIANIVKKINERSFKRKENTLPLVLTRISLGITLLYIGKLFTIINSSGPNSNVDIMIEFLSLYLAAVVTAAIFNIYISLRQTINESLIITTISIYVITGILGLFIIPSLAILSIIQVLLLIFACVTFKKPEKNN